MAQTDLPCELDDHNLFEFAPVVIWEADVTALQAWYHDLRAEGVTCLRSFLESDSQEVLYGLALVKIRRVNRAAVALFEAYDKQHLLQNTALIFATVPLSVLIDVLVARWENRLSLAVEARMCTLSGRQIHGLVGIAVPVKDGQPDVSHIILTFADITDRKRAEEARRESEERLRVVMKASGTGWWDWNLRSNTLELDEQCRALLGVPLDMGITFEGFRERLRPEDRPRVDETVLAALTNPGDYEVECVVQWADSSVHWGLLRGHSFHTQSGEPIRLMGTATDRRLKGVITVCQDITERKRAEEKLNKLNETLEQQVAKRTAVAERRANQLQVLASELARAEHRERRRLAKILHDHLQQILYAAKLKTSLLHRILPGEDATRLLQQTTELLDESLAESRSLAMALCPPVLYDRGLVGALEWLAREVRHKHDLPVHLELDEAAEPRDEGTRIFLFEAIRELLLNAVKHAQASEARIELAPLGEDRMRAVVSDTGRGFHPAEQEARETTAGFGLLSIRERLELLGGRLEIDSKPGAGTRIILEVPRGQSVTSAEHAREVVAAASSAALGTAQAPIQPAHSHKEVRVVVADDHRVLREGLITVLNEQPEIEVVGEAADGQQALDLALYMKPDVVLMDVSMPGMDGIEATRRIKEALPQVCVIGLSMHNRADMATAMREAGAADYLSKEVASDALVAVVLARGEQEA